MFMCSSFVVAAFQLLMDYHTIWNLENEESVFSLKFSFQFFLFSFSFLLPILFFASFSGVSYLVDTFLLFCRLFFLSLASWWMLSWPSLLINDPLLHCGEASSWFTCKCEFLCGGESRKNDFVNKMIRSDTLQSGRYSFEMRSRILFVFSRR